MNETQRALMEGERNAASDEYFGARPQIDTTDRRRVFEAGFDRAWKALLPTVCDCTTGGTCTCCLHVVGLPFFWYAACPLPFRRKLVKS